VKHKAQLGIIDWGIGGISIYNLIKSELGNIPVIYFFRHRVTPYGKMSRQELTSRLHVVLTFSSLARRNAPGRRLQRASTRAALSQSRSNEGCRRDRERHPPGQHNATTRLALIGGRRTVLSGVYRRAFAERGIAVIQRIAQPLSALIESGDVSSGVFALGLREDPGARQKLFAPAACLHTLTPLSFRFSKTSFPTITVLIDPARELIRSNQALETTKRGTQRFS